MTGIVAYGAYIPFNRLNRQHIRDVYGSPVPQGEKAVSNYDEDSLTMAVAAALDCASGLDTKDLSAVFFASTTPPYREKQSATTLAGTLDANRGVRTMDITGSLRSGSSAMMAGLDAAEKGEKVLLAISDSRLGGAGGALEALFGDGAAAFLLGNKNVVAAFLGSHTVAADFYDHWRSQHDDFVRNWEERFCQSQGYNIFTVEAAREAMKKTGLAPRDFARAVIYGLKDKDAVEVARKLGFSPEQVQDNMISAIGNTGAASAPMALVAALEKSEPGDKILFITYGEGSDAMVFQVTDAIKSLPARRGIQGYLKSKKTDMDYGKYLRWRELIPLEPQRRPPLVRPSLPDRYRNLKKILSFYGSRCTSCGTPQFPSQRVCINCQAIDQMEDYKFLGRKAKLATYTMDYLAPSLDPPTILAVMDFEGGGRFVCLMTDCDPARIEVGMELELSFRKLFEAEGIVTHFWKAVPKR